MRRTAMVLLACLSGCGDNYPAPPDAANEPPPFRPAPHAPMPRVLRHSGIVLSSVELVTLTFDDYAARDLVERFGDTIVGSPWYTTVGAEYGVRAGTHLARVSLGPSPASLTRDGIATLIKQRITDGAAPTPPTTGNQLLYLIYIPPSVSRGPDLDGISGYHQMLTLAGARFPIVVVVDSVGDDRGTGGPTLTAAHQLINAATNPYDPPNEGYYADPPMIDPWSLARGEVADLCDGELPVTDGELLLPRVYSDLAAAVGSPPCKPPMPGDMWNDVSAAPATMQMIPRGGSVTFQLTGWSTEKVPDWSLSTRVADFSQLTEAQMQPELSDDVINNGMSVTLTLHAPPTALRGATGGIYILSERCSSFLMARLGIASTSLLETSASCADRRWAVGFVVK